MDNNLDNNLALSILQTLKTTCPSMDWTSGSVGRELLAVPAALLGNVFDTHISNAERAFNLNTITSNPTDNEDVINLWFNWLGLSNTTATGSKGTVVIYVSSLSSSLVIMEGTAFTYNNNRVYATDTTTWKTADMEITSGDKIAIKNDDDTYTLEINVSTSAGTPVSIESGTPLGWTSAPTDLIGVYVGSSISGGKSNMTLSDKAAAIYDMLHKKTYATEDGLQSILRSKLPNIVNSIVVGNKQPEDVGNTVNVYVKTIKAPVSDTRFVSIRNGKGSLSGKGIVAVSNIKSTYGYTYDTDISGMLGDSDSTIQLTQTDDGEISTYDDTIAISVVCIDGYDDVYNTLNSAQSLSPCLFRLKTPIIATIGITLNTADTLPDTAYVAIQDMVNSKTLSETMITDADINRILSAYNIVINGQHFYTMSITSNTQQQLHTAVGSLGIMNDISGIDAPIACYTFINKIGTLNV